MTREEACIALDKARADWAVANKERKELEEALGRAHAAMARAYAKIIKTRMIVERLA